MKRKKGYFSISAVAKMFSIHQQTIRLYERQGLITPKRSEGNTRLFSEEDVNRLEEVVYLTHKLGINLAGVEMILKLKRQIKKLQKDMNSMFEETNKKLDSDVQHYKETIAHNAHELLKLKQQHDKKTKQQEQTVDVDIDTWQVDYDNKE